MSGQFSKAYIYVDGSERVKSESLSSNGRGWFQPYICLSLSPHLGKSMFRDLEQNSRRDSKRKTVFAEILAS